MKKVVLCGAAPDKERALEELQELGCMHLVPLASPARVPQELPSMMDKRVREALRYLLDAKQKRKQVAFEEDFDIGLVTEQARSSRRRKRAVQEKIDALRARIQDVEPWGNFTLPDIEDVAGYRFWFYVVPHYQLRRVTTEHPWEVVHRDGRYTYVVVLSSTELEVQVDQRNQHED